MTLWELFLFHSMSWCDIMNKGPPPKNIHFLIPRTCEYMALHGEKNFSDVTKILRLGDYYGLSGCSLEGMILKLKFQYFGTWCEELTHWKRLWCWEGLWAGGKGGDRGWDGWMASPTRWERVWVNSRSWLWTGMPGMLRFMGLRVGHDWATELNWWVIQLWQT